MTDAEWAVFLPRMTRFAELVKDFGLQLVYHHHMGTVVQTPEDVDRFMAGTGPAVKLLLDTGHITWAGGDAVRMAKTYAGRIGHVHAKDVRKEVAAKALAEDWSFLDSVLEGVYTVPGDGFIDFAGVFKALPDYSGWVVIEAEQDPKKANPKTYVTLGYKNLKRFLEEGGLALSRVLSPRNPTPACRERRIWGPKTIVSQGFQQAFPAFAALPSGPPATPGSSPAAPDLPRSAEKEARNAGPANSKGKKI